MRLSVLALCTATLTGCVFVTDPKNYRPQSASLSKDFYNCSQSANQPTAEAAWGSGFGYGTAGMQVKGNMLLRCMEAQNYRLRKANGAEYAVAVLSFPIWVPWVLWFGVDDVVFGGGSAADQPTYSAPVTEKEGLCRWCPECPSCIGD